MARVAAALLGRRKGAEPLVAPAPPSSPPPLRHPPQETLVSSTFASSCSSSSTGAFSDAAFVLVVVVVVVPGRKRAAQRARRRVEHEHRRPAPSQHDGAPVSRQRRRRVDEVCDARGKPRKAPPSPPSVDGRFRGGVSVEGAVDAGDERCAAFVARSPVAADAVLAPPSAEPSRGDQRAPAVKGPQWRSRGGLYRDEGAVEQGDEEGVGGGRKRPVFFLERGEGESREVRG